MADEEFEPLKNAPIDEAVIDLRVATHEDGLLERLADFAASLEDTYPQRSTQRVFEGRIHIEEDERQIESASGSVLGFTVRSGDGRQVLQLQRQGMTLSHLKPYQNWDALFGESWRLWEGYLEAARPESVTRIATRFVNRLAMPREFLVEDYFTTPISVPSDVPDNLAAFNYSYVINADDDVLANVRLATEPTADDLEHSSILLDIDCYIQRVRPHDDDSLPGDFLKLRGLKNRIFFNTLTEAAKELFR